AQQAWVTETGLKQVAVIDTANDKVSEFGLSIAPTFVAFSPDGCVAVAYDGRSGEFAKLDPDRRSTFDSVQRLPQPPQSIGLRVDGQRQVFLVLPDGTMQGPYRASCPLR